MSLYYLIVIQCNAMFIPGACVKCSKMLGKWENQILICPVAQPKRSK